MLFNSVQYLVFFPAVVAVYFTLPFRFRNVLLLAASYYFYMCWKMEYVLLIVASTLVDYIMALSMARASTSARRRAYLIVSIAFNLGLLFAFKYFNFFNEAFREAFAAFNLAYHVPQLHILLPVGISFYTFQTMSYTIDVYRGARPPERNPLVFALYVAFFPQLVAGPIERSTRLLPQFHERHRFDAGRARDGLILIGWGFFQKVVVADRLAVYVNAVYNDPGGATPATVLLATYFFAFQIYCDFAGYSNIAIGSAQVLGYDLMTNFRRPYLAASVREFWRRWHISLSTWFRDYLYVPLGGNRVSKSRLYANLLAVFLLSGLWHGANWTFLVWGLLHGGYMIASVATEGLRERWAQASGLAHFPRIRRVFQTIVTFHLIAFAWIFFRANSMTDVWILLKTLAAPSWSSLESVMGPLSPLNFSVAIMAIVTVTVIHGIQTRGPIRQRLTAQPLAVQWCVYYALLFAILIFGKFDDQPFLYFRF
ncbi:MAG: hypothetical protein QG656_406 [Candidatus Hydrogenedentes bacterium]|nr:hypothetical protein [Candidatus Hydrogenedentota bacterium]